MDAEICATTSMPLSRSRPASAARAPSRSPSMPVPRHARSAGMTPKRRPVTVVRNAAKTSTRASSTVASETGNDVGTRRASRGVATAASAIPAAPPIADSSSVSVSSCRTIRSRPAPSAARTVISRRRAMNRTRRRLARLVQAINSRQSEPPASMRRSMRDWFDTWSSSVRIVARVCSSSFGYVRSSDVITPFIWLRASWSVAPGFSRATTPSQLLSRSSSGGSRAGTQSCVSRSG